MRFELADGSRVDAVPEDEERLTREDITATVHYLKFPFTPRAAGGVRRRARRASWSTIPSTRAVVELTDEQRAELARDFTE